VQVQANWENQLIALAGTVSHPGARPFFSYWAGDASLRKAYQQAEKITAQHSRSFYFASGFLPEEKRSAVRALYAFCRTVDDIVDEPSDARQDSQLDYWRTMVETASFADNDLVAAAWADTLTRYHIPRHYALQLIDGVARDLSQSRYQTFDELATYCYSVASTVGLMSMYIVGFTNPEAVPYAIKLGVALQMTNILRDVGVGRIEAGFGDHPIVVYQLGLGTHPQARLVRGYEPRMVGSIGIGVRKGDEELLARINESLARRYFEDNMPQEAIARELSGFIWAVNRAVNARSAATV